MSAQPAQSTALYGVGRYSEGTRVRVLRRATLNGEDCVLVEWPNTDRSWVAAVDLTPGPSELGRDVREAEAEAVLSWCNAEERGWSRDDVWPETGGIGVIGKESAADWLRRKAEYTASLSMSTVRVEFEAGNLAGVLHALARLAEREERASR